MAALALVASPQPHYLPGYKGHCPEYKFRVGNTYGSTTHKILLDPSVHHSENLILSNRTADDYQLYRPAPNAIEMVNSRLKDYEPIYRHPMVPGYEGFVPRLISQFGQRYTVSATEGLSEFQRLQVRQAALKNRIERTIDLQSGKGDPKEFDDKFETSAQFKLPLIGVAPGCEGIIKQIPIDEAKQRPAWNATSPYFMENEDPEKYIKQGFSGHVPFLFKEFGKSSKPSTNSALCDFSSNYKRRESTEWAPVTIVK